MSENVVKISIKVLPNARNNEIVGFSNDILRVKIAAPPDKGKANRELIDFFSEKLGLKKDNFIILRGAASHNKLLSIKGLSLETVLGRLITGGPAK
jgi:uncharacterized protein